MKMARPIKVGLSYFSFDVDFFSDDKIAFVSAKYGLLGEAVTIRLLAKIYRNSYYIKWDEDSKILFASTLKVPKDIDAENLVDNVIEELFKREFFNREMYDKYSILTGSGIQKRFIKACSDSGRQKSKISVNWDLTGINQQETIINQELTSINSPISTQTKQNKTKLNKTKQEDTITDTNSTNNPEVMKCFAVWSRPPKNLGEVVKVENLIKSYDFDKVKNAFHIAAEKDVCNISYVIGILTNNKPKEITNATNKPINKASIESRLNYKPDPKQIEQDLIRYKERYG